MALLVILFCMLLNMLFNAICRNKMTSLVLTLAILLLGMGIAQPANTETWYAWLPFTYFNPVDILSGYTSYTYLNGILTLGISCGLLYVATRWIFRKRMQHKKSAHLRQHQPASTYAKQHITAYVEKLWHNGIRCSDFFFLRPRIYHGRLRGICSHGGFPTSSSPSSTITDSGNSPRYQAACAR